jgi:hypothetical protein
MTLSLLLSPIFASSKRKKEMGDGSKLATIALFVVTTRGKR